jgi:hypothetical protein
MWTYLKFLQKQLQKVAEIWAQSTDYKSATDYIPLDMILAIWSGLFGVLPDKHPFWVFFDLIVSNRRLTLLDFKHLLVRCNPEYTGEDKIDLNHMCGSFMGEPMSYMTLDMINILIEEVSEYIFISGDKILANYRGETLPKDPSCICGDDFAALRTSLLRILIFKETATRAGMVLSWKDQVSKRVLIFCEDHVLIRNKKPVYVDVVKSRLLTGMARQHSDNRSSILGKGRMLRNQLDYFEDINLKRSIMTVYYSVFNRIHKYSLDHTRLPIWLPPVVGGLGFPIYEEDIPSWGWKYIKFVYDIIDIDDKIERFIRISELRVMNAPSKKGIQTWSDTLKILSKYMRKFSYHQYDGNIDNVVIESDKIYSDQVILDLLEKYQVLVPKDPYDPTKFDWDSLKNEASKFGFIKAEDFLSEVERTANFQSFLSQENTRSQRTYTDYCRKAKKYFWRHGLSVNERHQNITKSDVPRFTTWVKLEKAATFILEGWITVNDPRMNFFNSTVSLKLNLHTSRFQRQVALRGLKVSEYQQILDVQNTSGASDSE